MRASTSLPRRRLSLICAVVLMSSMACSTCGSRTVFTLTPPTWSAAFSLLAIQRAALLLAPLVDSAKTLAPRASGRKKASAWMLTKRSACTRWALRTRSCRGTKKSASRVIITRMPGTAFSVSRSASATASTTSFSRKPLGPTAPGSSPPWPGSNATMIKRSTRRCSAGVGAAGRAAGVGSAGCVGTTSGGVSPKANGGLTTGARGNTGWMAAAGGVAVMACAAEAAAGGVTADDKGGATGRAGTAVAPGLSTRAISSPSASCIA